MTLITPMVISQKEIQFKDFPEFFGFIREKKFVCTFSARKGGTFVSPKGIQYQIFPDAFVDTRGTPVDEMVRLEITEAINKKDLFLQDRPTLLDGQLMDQSLFLSFQLKGNTQVGLKLTKPIHCTWSFKAKQKLQNLYLLEETKAQTRLVHQKESYEWSPSNDQLFLQKNGSSSRTLNFYAEKLGSYAIGRTLPRKVTQKPAMLSLKLSEQFSDLKNYRVFLIYHSFNTIAKLVKDRNRLVAFNLIKESPATLLVLGLKDQQIFFYKKYLPQISNQLLRIDLIPTNFHDLNKTLNRINY